MHVKHNQRFIVVAKEKKREQCMTVSSEQVLCEWRKTLFNGEHELGCKKRPTPLPLMSSQSSTTLCSRTTCEHRLLNVACRQLGSFWLSSHVTFDSKSFCACPDAILLRTLQCSFQKQSCDQLFEAVGHLACVALLLAWTDAGRGILLVWTRMAFVNSLFDFVDFLTSLIDTAASRTCGAVVFPLTSLSIY